MNASAGIKLLICLGAACIFTAAQAAGAEKMGAERHMSRGLSCTTCHGADQAYPAYPDEKTCSQCHPRAALIAKTNKPNVKNPHAAPHNSECTLCHLQHEKPVDYCSTCHKFSGYKVP